MGYIQRTGLCVRDSNQADGQGASMSGRSSIILALGLVLSAFVFGRYFHAARMSPDAIRVVGSATKRIDAGM